MDCIEPFFVAECMKEGIYASLPRVPPPPPTFVFRPPPPPPPARSRRHQLTNKVCDQYALPTLDEADDLAACRCEYVRPSESNLELVASMRMTPLARELWTELLLEANRQRIRKEFEAIFPQQSRDGSRRCCYCQGTYMEDFRRPNFRKDMSRQPSRSTVDSETKLSSGRGRLTPKSARGLAAAFPEECDFFVEADVERSPESVLWMLNCPDYNI